MRRSCRVVTDTECVVSITLVVTLGSLPVIAVFLAPNGQHPASMQIKDAIMASSLRDQISDTQLICNLKPGTYMVSYGLQDTNQADAQLTLYASSPLKFFWSVCSGNTEGLQIGAQLLDEVGVAPSLLYVREKVLRMALLQHALDEEILLVPLHPRIKHCNHCLSESTSFNTLQQLVQPEDIHFFQRAQYLNPLDAC